jgi:hypothetical protein
MDIFAVGWVILSVELGIVAIFGLHMINKFFLQKDIAKGAQLDEE